MRTIAWMICALATIFAEQAVAQQSCPTLVVATNDDVANGDTSSPCALIADPGADGISLREALLAANNASGSGTITITFAPALAGTTIALTERFAPITRSQITLTGPTSNGQPNISIDASGASNPITQLFFIATSNFTMSGMNVINLPTNFAAMQIGGFSYSLTGQMVSSPAQICCIQITGNAFSNTTNNNATAIFVSATANGTNNSTISDVAIANNAFSNLYEAVNVQGGGNNNVIQDVIISNNSFSQMTANGTSAVELGDTTGTNNTIQNVQIIQNTFMDNFAGVALDINSTTTGSSIQNTVIERNVFVGNLQAMGLEAGVNSGTTNNVITNTQIVDNLVDLTGYNGQGAATIQIQDNQSGTNNRVTGVSFVNNTIYNGSSASPPGWGVWVTSSGGVTGVSIWNSIFWGNESTAPLNGITSGQVSYSIVDQSGFSGVNKNLNSDPLFVNSSGGNFGLQSGSPARGAGISAGAPLIDLDCQRRSSPPSIGAYELDGPDICPSSGVYAPAATHDFNGDGYSDIAWRGPTGDVAIWLMDGMQILSGPDLGNVPTSWTIVGQRPFNNSGYADLLWRSSTGDLSIWFMNGTQILSTADFGTIPTSWSIAGTGAYNASNGYAELFWRSTAGDVAIWQINGSQILAAPDIGNVPTSWTIAGIGDFSGTGATDILWRGPTGDVAIWFMNGTQIVSAPDFINVPTSWTIVGTGDFNGDGKTDILWRSSTGDVGIWLMNGTQILSSADLANVPTSWTIAETGDFNGDGYSDILWRGPTGDVAIWFMNGTQILSSPDFVNVPTNWTIQGANAD